MTDNELNGARPAVRRVPGTSTFRVGDEAIVHREETDVVTHLPADEALVWEALGREVEVGSLTELTGLSDADVATALDQLAEGELVEGMTRRDFAVRGGAVAATAGLITLGLPMAAAHASTPPAITGVTTSNFATGTVNRFDVGDSITLTFDQVLAAASVPATGTFSASKTNQIITITFSNLFTATCNTANNGNFTAVTGTYSAVQNTINRTVTATLTAASPAGQPSGGGGGAIFVFAPASGLTSLNGVPANPSATYTPPAAINIF